MIIDIEYIKNLLDTILENDHPDFSINHDNIKPLWLNDEKLKVNEAVQYGLGSFLLIMLPITAIVFV